MILPNSWNKPSLQNATFPTRWRLVKNEKLPLNSFTFEDKDYKVPCSFQVWVKDSKGLDLRWDINPKVIHKDFTFVEKEDADFFMMGASPKTLKHPNEVSKSNRGYYIKSNIDLSLLRKALTDIPWDDIGNATAGGGVYWISKPELIKAYSDYKGETL
jgi:hypothetical protein